MKKKIYMTALLFMLLLLCVPVKVQAYATEKEDTLYTEGDIIRELNGWTDKKQEIKACIENDNAGGKELQNPDTSYDMNHTILTNLTTSFLISEYEKSGSFEKCITNDTRYLVPYETDQGGGIATLAEENGTMECVLESEGGKRENIPEAREALARKIFNKAGKNEKISRVLYAYSDMYHLNMVYAKTDKNEYLIPYFEESRQIDSSDKQTRIENGRIYTAENFMKRMNAIYDEEAFKSNPDANTGVPKRETAGVVDHSSKLLIIVTMLCTASLGSIFVFVRRRRKFTESHSEGIWYDQDKVQGIFLTPGFFDCDSRVFILGMGWCKVGCQKSV